VIAGIAATIFPASGDLWQTATIEESEQFLSAYIRASTRAWTADDTEAFSGVHQGGVRQPRDKRALDVKAATA